MLITPTDSYHYLDLPDACVDWKACSLGTIDDNYHLLYAWMTGGGPEGEEYTADQSPEYCETQVCVCGMCVCVFACASVCVCGYMCV
jgi:hypothetical protein